MLKLGIQFWPWTQLPELLSHCQEAYQAGFDQIWIVDDLEYEDPFTVLAVLADRYDVSLGTLVTFPRRDPLHVAQRFASIAKLLHPGKELSVGLGSGGVIHAYRPEKSVASIRICSESIRFMAGLLAGDAVQIGRFPGLVASFGYNPQASIRLHLAPGVHVPIYFAANGPKMIRTGVELADGLVVTSLGLRSSLFGMRNGLFKGMVEEIGRHAPVIFTIKFSVSRDADAARQLAKRQVSYSTATEAAYAKACGLNAAEIDHIRDAYDRHLGIEQAASRVSDELLGQLGKVVAGTPAQCLDQLEEMLGYLKAANFNLVQVVPGVPLGPDLSEAVRLINGQIVPVLRKWLD